MAVQKPETTDIAIVGGGLVGSSLACALAHSGLSITLVEAAPAPTAPAGFDQRKLALAGRSVGILRRLGVLAHLAVPPTPITRIHISRTGDFGRVLLQAAEYGHEAFGAVVLAQDLGMALAARVAELGQIRRLCPAQVTHCRTDAEGASLQVATPDATRTLQARLLAAADGTDSFIRRALGIGTVEHDYRQTLFVCSLRTGKASDGTAFERFSRQGPVALLPMADGMYGAVCGVDSSLAPAVAGMDDGAYRDYLQDRFGWRAGKFLQAGTRTHYPLKRVLAERVSAASAVLLGNAAQTIHPIGAQGFNLGLRDAMSLVQVLQAGGPDAGAGARYAQAREDDRERTLAFSDGLARLTANDGLPMHLLRSLALGALGAAPGLAAGLVAGAMGYRGGNAFEEAL